MKSKFFIFLIILLTCFSQINIAQNSSGHNVRHAITLEFPFNYKEKYRGPDQIFLFQIGWEVNWKREGALHQNVVLGVGYNFGKW
jgi:hypothetical protein